MTMLRSIKFVNNIYESFFRVANQNSKICMRLFSFGSNETIFLKLLMLYLFNLNTYSFFSSLSIYNSVWEVVHVIKNVSASFEDDILLPVLNVIQIQSN